MTAPKDFDGSKTLILSPRDLKKGMYVSYLDRPWTQAPFPFQGFKIETDAELEQLREVCDYVFVDSRRGSMSAYESYNAVRGRTDADDTPPPDEQAVERPPTEREFPAAREAHEAFRKALISVYETASRGGSPSLAELDRATTKLIASVRRNPDALLYFVRTQTDGDYLFRHGVACAVMACTLGDALGLSSRSLQPLTMGCSLLDIGKTRVPAELLNRPSALELSPGELQQLRRHVERGAEILSHVTSEGSPITTVVMTHHERHDGKGYPRGIAGDRIPRFGKIASLVDTFDAMVSERVYGRRATPYEAMRYIKAQRGEAFDPKLVDVFQRAFGTYPTGSLVELSTGEVGFVIQQNPGARLQPRVYVMLDANKQRVPEFRVIDLGVDKTNCVEKGLKAGSYGFDF